MGVKTGDTVLRAWGGFGIARVWKPRSTATEICTSEVNNSESKDVKEVKKNI